MTSVKQRSTVSLIQRLFREEARGYWGQISLGIACMIVIAVTTATMAHLMEPVINKIFIEKSTQTLYSLSFAIFMTFFLKSFATFGESYILGSVGQKIVVSIQNKLYRHILSLPYIFFQKQNSGSLVSRFIHDVRLLEGTVTQTLSSLVKDALTIIALAGLMIYYDWELAMISLVLFPLALLPLSKLARRMRKTAHTIQSTMGDITGLLTQSFQGIRIIKAYHVEAYEVTRMNLILQDFLKRSLKGIRIKALSHPIMEFAGGVAIVIIIAYWGNKVIHSGQTPGAFFAFITSLLMMYEPAKRAAKLHTQLQESLTAASRVYDILDMFPENQLAVISTKQAPQEQGLNIRNLSFRFHEETEVLQDINVDIRKGEFVAIIGPSGSGKTTLFNMIMRFYDSYSGDIFWDGKDIRNMNLQELRAQIGLVSQEVTLFDDTVRANVALGLTGLNREVEESAIRLALSEAACDDFVDQLEQGIHTQVGELGSKISGGQRQRIALARALLRKPQLLLLDEATSALDSQSERQIQDQLAQLRGQSTILVIAHRLSTIQNADKIILLNKGRLEAMGTHTQLIETCPLYAELCRHQFGGAS